MKQDSRERDILALAIVEAILSVPFSADLTTLAE